MTAAYGRRNHRQGGTCRVCEVRATFAPEFERSEPPSAWTYSEDGWACLACAREAARVAARGGDGGAVDRLIFAELRRGAPVNQDCGSLTPWTSRPRRDLAGRQSTAHLCRDSVHRGMIEEMRDSRQAGIYTAAHLAPELRARAEEVARHNGWSLAHVLRVALRDYVSGDSSPADAGTDRGRPWRTR